jgi:subtilisin
MRDDSIVQQYVVLPARGIVATEASASREIRSYLISLHSSMNNPGTLKRPQKSIIPMRILDSIHENGAKLVELSAQSASDLRAELPGLRLVPVVYYYPQVHRPPLPLPSLRTATATVGTKIVVKVVSKKDGKPVGGALVVAFTDFANRIGAQGKTNKSGDAVLVLGSSSKKVERLYVFPEKNYWGSLKRNATLKAGFTVGITPVDLRYTDALRFFYSKSTDTAGNGLTVGVIDTGVGPHSDLRVAGGRTPSRERTHQTTTTMVKGTALMSRVSSPPVGNHPPVFGDWPQGSCYGAIVCSASMRRVPRILRLLKLSIERSSRDAISST